MAKQQKPIPANKRNGPNSMRANGKAWKKKHGAHPPVVQSVRDSRLNPKKAKKA